MVRPSSKPSIAGPERVRWRHSGHTPRRNAGLAAYENVLARAGFSPVAGIDEAGRGACAGPLVVAAVVLDNQAVRPIRGLADSKALTPEEREDVYTRVMRHALDWHVVAIPAPEVDQIGLHVSNVEGMRRALAGLRHRPAYVLTDGFPVRGLGTPALAVWKGDQVTASVAAASIVAKVTRDRMMVELDESYPAYGFAKHKGYSTPEHMSALCAWGPCPEHRYSYVNVIQANRRWATGWQDETGLDGLDGEALVDEDAVDEDAVNADAVVGEGLVDDEGVMADAVVDDAVVDDAVDDGDVVDEVVVDDGSGADAGPGGVEPGEVEPGDAEGDGPERGNGDSGPTAANGETAGAWADLGAARVPPPRSAKPVLPGPTPSGRRLD
jgi:ribonuclease HII